jgi:hypothetical protein
MRIITRHRCPAEAADCVSAGVGIVLTPSGTTAMRIIVLSFAIVFCLGGCHKAQEAATEAAIETASGHKVDVQRDGDKVTYKSDEGEVTMQRQGWKQVTAMQQATGSAMLAFEKEKRHVALSFNRNRQGAGTVVSVQMQDDVKR